jgi:GR25 family glycosyltransferase involved in LPS biosynthesis
MSLLRPRFTSQSSNMYPSSPHGARTSAPTRRSLVIVTLAACLLLLFISLPYRSNVASFAQSTRDAWRPNVGQNGVDSSYRRPLDVVDDQGYERPLDPVEHVVKADPEDMAYREHLDKEHAPHPFSEHSPTLTFSRIYILSLPFRTDRRERMTKLMRALGLDFEFVDATSKDAPVIQWIGERAAEIRRRKRELLAESLDMLPEEVGGMGIGSIWLEPSQPLERIVNLDRPKKNRKKVELPSLADDEYHGTDWVSFLESAPRGYEFQPTYDDFNVTEAMWDPLEENSFRQINEAVIATWYSQTRVWKLMEKNGDESALILEDDVDLEWDIDRIWPNIWRRLPGEDNGKVVPWQVTFLGHCWGRELTSALIPAAFSFPLKLTEKRFLSLEPSYLHPLLHRSTEPRCLHGYSLSRTGVRHLLRLLSDPWVAYQAAIDTIIPTYIGRDAIAAFSVEPPLIIQSKDTPSDIQQGVGSPWRGVLADSTMERIWRDEGLEIPDLDADASLDPATRSRLSDSKKQASKKKPPLRQRQ